MRLTALTLAAILTAGALQAQQTGTSTAGGDSPSTAGQPSSASSPNPQPTSELPVSLDRIREGLAKSATGTGLKNIDLKPDFVVRVEERDHLQEILSKLDFKSGPTPPGGIYAYEQQQRAINKIERPLQQPYAAFSGGELITLAIEGLVQKYLGAKIGEVISSAQRASAERAAREEVATAIAVYCDSREDGGRTLHLCTEALTR